MKLRHILILATVADQPVAPRLKLIFRHQTLHGLEHVSHKRRISRRDFHHGGNGLLGYDQDMHRINRLGMLKRHQRVGFSQTLYGDSKTHIREHPSDE